MNERIRELLLKAGFTNAYTNPEEGFELVFVDEEHTTESVAKFAELIVRECSYLADQAHKKATGGKSAGGYIREHFGVEE